MLAATITYEVQGRRTERDHVGRSREVVRLDTATDRANAFDIARGMGSEALTAWVLEAEHQPSKPPSYKLLGVVQAGTC